MKNLKQHEDKYIHIPKYIPKLIMYPVAYACMIATYFLTMMLAFENLNYIGRIIVLIGAISTISIVFHWTFFRIFKQRD